MATRIAALPEEAELVQDSLEVAEYNRRFKEDYGCYFVLSEDGGEVAIWGVWGFTPYNNDFAYEMPSCLMLG